MTSKTVIDLTLIESDSEAESTRVTPASINIINKSSTAERDTTSGTPILYVEGIPIGGREVAILKDPHDWLTDEIINAYGQVLTKRHNNIHCCSTFFFTRLSEGERPDTEAWLRRWKSKLSLPKDMLFFPINWSNSHWALAAYSCHENTLRYYDSLMSSSRAKRALSILKHALEVSGLAPTEKDNYHHHDTDKDKNAVGVLAFIMSKVKLSTSPSSTSTSASRSPSTSKSTSTSQSTSTSIIIETPAKQPQQMDGSSCGVFACWWMARLASPSNLLNKSNVSINPIAFRKTILDSILSASIK